MSRAERGFAYSLPDFVTQRLEAFTQKRFREEWGGRHLLHGAAPGRRGLRLSSNDYLSRERVLHEVQTRCLIERCAMAFNRHLTTHSR